MPQRPKTRRDSPEVAANNAARLLNDPAFKKAIEAVRAEAINAIVTHKHDGSEDSDAFEREQCRQLRTLEAIVRKIAAGPQWRALLKEPNEKENNSGGS